MRLVYLDNLRAILMVMGLVLHTCAAFSPKMYWIVTYHETIPWVDYINDFIHIFRMPLFFMISGFFAYLLMQKQSISKFVSTKFLRIAVPFLTALLLINFPQFWLVEYLQDSGADYRVQNHDVSAHLWFLVNLLLYFIIYVALHPIVVFFKAILTRMKVSLVFSLLILSAPIIYLSVLALNKIGIPIYSAIPITGSLFSLLAYIDYFLLGALFACLGHDKISHFIKSRSALLLIIAVGALSIAFLAFPALNSSIIDDYFAHLQAIVLSLVVWRFGEIALNRSGRFFRQFSDASYSIYLFHHILIILLVIAFNAIFIHWGWSIDPNALFCIIVLSTLILTVLIHKYIVSSSLYTSILFNGKK